LLPQLKLSDQAQRDNHVSNFSTLRIDCRTKKTCIKQKLVVIKREHEANTRNIRHTDVQ